MAKEERAEEALFFCSSRLCTVTFSPASGCTFFPRRWSASGSQSTVLPSARSFVLRLALGAAYMPPIREKFRPGTFLVSYGCLVIRSCATVRYLSEAEFATQLQVVVHVRSRDPSFFSVGYEGAG